MNKKSIVVFFGGMSTEHEVSRMSATSVLKNINKEKYNIGVVGIDKDGSFLEYIGEYENIVKEDWKIHTKKIEDIISYIKEYDVAYPILHGLYGEDGTIQGLFELLKIPYVGPKVLASAVAMDKVYTKIVFDRAGIKQVPSVYIKAENDKIILVDEKFNEINDEKSILNEIEIKIGYPAFVKPSNSGSSVGVSKVLGKEELLESIKEAKKYDRKILVEKAINARELECAVLEQNGEIKASVVGEILPAGDFYSYESKYQDENSGLAIPANVDSNVSEYIRETAIKAFKAIDGNGLSRVDFFLDRDTGETYLNEINTLPGFTNISMYPKLWGKSGIEYSKLIDVLIENAK